MADTNRGALFMTNAILGGLFIGFSAVLLLLFLGRIAGISGILWGATQASRQSLGRWLFIIGLVFGAWIYHHISGQQYPSNETPTYLLVIAGLLVGAGVKIGSGCTIGHGVCGIARLSVRSLAATVTFILAGIITVFIRQ